MSTRLSDKMMSMLSQMSYLEVNVDGAPTLKYAMDTGQLTIKDFMEFHQDSEEYQKKFGSFSQQEINDFINQCGDYKIKEDIPYNGTKQSGLYGYIIEIEKGEAIVALRGSEEFINDWKNNFSLPYSIQTKQQADLLEFISNNKELFDNYQSLHVTGHSLGGNLALYMTVASELKDKIIDCRTFNAPGFSEEFIKMHAQAIEEMSPYIKEFQNEHDIVSSLLHNLTKPYICQNKEIMSWTTFSNFTHHSISDLSFNADGSFNYDAQIDKDTICKQVNLITFLVDKLPESMSESIVEFVFQYLDGSASKFDWIILMILGNISGKILSTPLGRKLITLLLIIGLIDLLIICAGEPIEILLNRLLDKIKEIIDVAINTLLEFGFNITKEIIGFIKELYDLLEKMIDKMIENFKKIVSSLLDFGRDKILVDYGSLNIDLIMLEYIRNKLMAIEHLANNVQWKLFALNTSIISNPLINTNPIQFHKPQGIDKVEKHIKISIKELEDCERYIKTKVMLMN